jgi:hypothetical protein
MRRWMRDTAKKTDGEIMGWGDEEANKVRIAE